MGSVLRPTRGRKIPRLGSSLVERVGSSPSMFSQTWRECSHVLVPMPAKERMFIVVDRMVCVALHFQNSPPPSPTPPIDGTYPQCLFGSYSVDIDRVLECAAGCWGQLEQNRSSDEGRARLAQLLGSSRPYPPRSNRQLQIPGERGGGGGMGHG